MTVRTVRDDYVNARLIKKFGSRDIERSYCRRNAELSVLVAVGVGELLALEKVLHGYDTQKTVVVGDNRKSLDFLCIHKLKRILKLNRSIDGYRVSRHNRADIVGCAGRHYTP